MVPLVELLELGRHVGDLSWRADTHCESTTLKQTKGTTMFNDVRKRVRDRRQRARVIRTITSASQPQRDELVVMAQRQGLL